MFFFVSTHITQISEIIARQTIRHRWFVQFWKIVSEMPRTRMGSRPELVPLFGALGRPLSDSGDKKLPTIKNILCAIHFQHQTNNNAGITYKEIVRGIVQELLAIWQSNSLPVLSRQRVECMVTKHLKQYKYIIDSFLKRTFAKQNHYYGRFPRSR